MILKVNKLLHILLAPGFQYGACNGGDPFQQNRLLVFADVTFN